MTRVLSTKSMSCPCSCNGSQPLTLAYPRNAAPIERRFFLPFNVISQLPVIDAYLVAATQIDVYIASHSPIGPDALGNTLNLRKGDTHGYQVVRLVQRTLDRNRNAAGLGSLWWG